jgi:hypothetical protein
VEVVRRDRNHPSIIGWCPSNETPVEAGPLQAAVVSVTRAVDPTRPVIESSGGSQTIPDPDVRDVHDYEGDPAVLRARWMARLSPDVALPARYGSSGGVTVPFMNSEYGGLGWYEAGAPAWSYGNAPKTLDEFYARYAGLTDALLDDRFFFGFTYTQLTDVEQERNGIYCYDRRPKFDAARLKAINSRQAAYESDPPLAPRVVDGSWVVLVGAAPDGDLSRPWRSTVEGRPADGWTGLDFDDSGWKTGRGGFGSGGKDSRIRTQWAGNDIWLRQDFTVDGAPFASAVLAMGCGGEVHVYVSGVEVWNGEGWNGAYTGLEVTEALRNAVRKGKNTIAVHCHQEEGDRFVDLALLVAKAAK